MSEKQEPKYVYRYPPCPEHDVEATESWLTDMASKGYVLSRDGFFFGFGIFEKTEPRALIYRLEADRKRFNSFSDFQPPAATEFYEEWGWQYVAARGYFHIYCNSNPDTMELHTDPKIQADTINAARKSLRNSLIFELIYLLLFFGLRFGLNPVRYPLFLTAVAFSTPVFIFFCIVLMWYMIDLIRGFNRLNYLRRKLKTGQSIDHSKDWRRGKLRYIVSRITTLLMTVLFFLLLFRSCSRTIENPNEIPIDDYSGTIPFATMADFVPGSELKHNFLLDDNNRIEVRKDILAPVVIDFNEHGTIKTSGGLHLNGGLYVDYLEAANGVLANEFYREFITMAKGNSHYKPLELTLTGPDKYAAFIDVVGNGVVMRKGNTVIYARYYQTGDITIPLEQWAQAMAESIS